MSQLPPSVEPKKLSFAQWMLVVLASIGFLFDIYEILILPLIAEPAMQELIGSQVEKGTDLYTEWARLLFFVPALCGGIFGLLGGYLTDRLGRRRVLTWSILLYAVSAFLAGFSTNMYMLLILRCTTFIGVCVEFVAAVAWLAEMFPNKHQREKVLGYTQAFSSVGGLLAAIMFGWISQSESLRNSLPPLTIPEWFPLSGTVSNPHAAWRYGLMSGAIPAIPLIIIRPFLPESPVWKQRRDAGTLKRASFGEIFSPKYRKATIVATIMFACSYGIAFGALQQTPRMIDGVPAIGERVDESKKLAMSKAIPEWKRAQGQVLAGELPEESPEKTGQLLQANLEKHFAERMAAVQKQKEVAVEANKPENEINELTLHHLGLRALSDGLFRINNVVKTQLEKDKAAANKDSKAWDASARKASLATALDNYLNSRKKTIAVRASRTVKDPEAANAQKIQEIGGLVGRFLLAFLILRVASRRSLFRLFMLPALLAILATYLFLYTKGSYFLWAGLFLAGVFTIGQFSFWGNYLPTQYPVHLRGTGATFAANIGGRILGTMCAAISITLAGTVFKTDAPGPPGPESFALASATVGGAVCLLGLLMSFFLPEPSQEVEADSFTVAH